jgi:Domain of unknown function (DUF4124)
MMRFAAFALATGLCLAPAAARAELYKCQGPDGKTLFTSDRSQCPGAEEHQPSGRLQRAHSSGASPAAPRSAPPAASVADDEIEAQTWRAKRMEAEGALQQTSARLATLTEVVSWCNRGHGIWAADQDGLRHEVDCEEVDAKERELRREQKRLEAYLAEGLEEECRRAGCLPGWIR